MYKNRVEEFTLTTGTANFSLGGKTKLNLFTFYESGSVGDTFIYVAAHSDEPSVEIGKGTLVSSTVLSRDEIIFSTNNNEKVNFAAGVKVITNTIPKELAIALTTVPGVEDYGKAVIFSEDGFVLDTIEGGGGSGELEEEVEDIRSDLDTLTSSVGTAISDISNLDGRVDTLEDHLTDTNNPHSVTASQVGNAIAQWNADKIRGITVTQTAPSDEQVLTYDSGTESILFRTLSGGNLTLPLGISDGGHGKTTAREGLANLGGAGPFINGVNYGLTGDGSTDDTTAFRAAVTAAMSANVPLFLPPGTYKLVATTEYPNIVLHYTNLTILGSGRENTILDVYPKVSDAISLWCFESILNGSKLIVKDLTILGATSTTASGTALNTTVDCGVVKATYQAPYTNSGVIDFINVDVNAPYWTKGVWAANGAYKIRYLDCNIHVLFDCIDAYESTNTTDQAFVEVIGGVLHSGRTAAECGGDPTGVCIYAHPAVSVKVTGTHFIGNKRACVKQYSVNQDPAFPPLWSNFSNCTCEDCEGFFLITPGLADSVSVVSNCSLGQAAVGIRNTTLITNCTFDGAGFYTPAGSLEPNGFTATIKSCSFKVRTAGNLSLCDMAFGNWYVEDCKFVYANSTNSGAIAINMTASANPAAISGFTTIKNCLFVDPHAQTIYSYVRASLTRVSNVVVDGCKFVGTPTYGAVRMATTHASSVFEVNNCDFVGITGAGKPLGIDNEDNDAGVIRGEGNRFGANVFTGQGTLRPSYITIRKAINYASVASAGNVYLDRDFNQHKISGTTTINNIYLANSGGTSQHPYLVGDIILQFEGALTLSNSGNINPMFGGSRNVVAGERVQFAYDNSTSEWYEVGNWLGNVSINGNLISTRNSNGDLQLGANGTGKVDFTQYPIDGFLGVIGELTGASNTLDVSYSGKCYKVSHSSSTTLTLPNNAEVGFNARFIQTGAGQLSFSAASGATISNRQSHTKSAGQNADTGLLVISNSDGSSAVYLLSGDTSA